MLTMLARKLWLGVTLTVALGLASLVAITSADASAPTKNVIVPKTSLSCDDKATDNKIGDDCIKHVVVGDAADGKATAGKRSKVRVMIAPELRGKSLLGEIQYRSVARNGSKSQWRTHRTVTWQARDTAKGATKTFETCAPVKAGNYQMRVQLAVPVSKAKISPAKTATTTMNRSKAFDTATASATPTSSTTPTASAIPTASSTPTATPSSTPSVFASPTSSASSVQPAVTMTPTPVSPSASASPSIQPKLAPYTTSDAIVSSAVSTVSVPQSSTSATCSNSADDQTLIEYFNMENFQQGFQVSITNTSSSAVSIALTCPVSPSPSFPGPDFDLTMQSSDGSVASNCRTSQPFSLNLTDVVSGAVPYCSTSLVCNFNFIFSNGSTGTVFSTTVWQISLPANPLPNTAGAYSNTIIPSLNAATLPVCNDNLSPCLLSGTCSLTTSKNGGLSLCSSGSACSAPNPSAAGYSINSQVYFQTMIANKVT